MVKGARTTIRLLSSPSVPSRPDADIDPLPAPPSAPGARVALRGGNDGARERGSAAPAPRPSSAGRSAEVPSSRSAVPRGREPAHAQGPVVGVPGHRRRCWGGTGSSSVGSGRSDRARGPAARRSTRSSGTSFCAWPERTQGGATFGSRVSCARWASGSGRRRSGGSSSLTGSDRLPGAQDRRGRSS